MYALTSGAPFQHQNGPSDNVPVDMCTKAKTNLPDVSTLLWQRRLA